MEALEIFELQLSALNQRAVELTAGISAGYWGFAAELERVEWQLEEISGVLDWYRATCAQILALAGDERAGFTVEFEDGIPKRAEERPSARSVLQRMEVHSDLGFRLQAFVKQLVLLDLLAPEAAAGLDLTPPKHPKLEEERQREFSEYKSALASRDALLTAVKNHAPSRGDLPDQAHRSALNVWNRGRYHLTADDVTKFAGELAKAGLLPPFYRAVRSLTELANKLGIGGSHENT